VGAAAIRVQAACGVPDLNHGLIQQKSIDRFRTVPECGQTIETSQAANQLQTLKLLTKIIGHKHASRIAGMGVSVPKFHLLARISLRFLAALLGLGLLGFLVFRTGPGIVWKDLQTVGWGLALIIILGGFSQLVKAWAWRQAFTCDISELSWSRSIGTQLASDAMGQLGVAGKLLGEGIRISFLGPAVPLPNGISACAIDGALHSFTAAIISVLGVTATLFIAPLSGVWRVYGLVVSSMLIAVMILAGVAVASHWPLAGNAARAIGRLPFLHNWVSSKQSIIDSAENNLLEFHHKAPASFWASLGLNALWHALAVLEVFIVLRFMGARIAPVGAFVVEGMTKVINLVGALNPGNLGTYEAGNMLIAKMFGVTGTTGLTLALCRRARALFWAGVGAMSMALMKRTDWTRRSVATNA
jgi:hypothetical protein